MKTLICQTSGKFEDILTFNLNHHSVLLNKLSQVAQCYVF